MADEPRRDNVNDVHIRMWTHYDDLRQRKHATFLTANTILAATLGLTASEVRPLLVAIPALGAIVAIAWFLMLTRNDAYIEFHRTRVGVDWRPSSWTPRSSVLDRTLPTAFGLFWAFLLVQQALGG